MTKRLDCRIENDILLNGDSVWTLSKPKGFRYSDGIASERYLQEVFTKAQDLSSASHELETWIKDWPSEYHLSAKRSQLLKCFDFDRSKKILEVGCGCGAITRFLGETFDDVVSIEGSLARASLARLRTRGMDNVSILSAPFQEIKFTEKFDIIFCVGVFEYSGAFVDAPDPYDAILSYFDELLTSDGQLILAIENQFGLKYFSSSREDHTNRMFEGIEGYPNFGDSVRTFGYDELSTKLNRYFSAVEFYFPFPDYKLPVCVLSGKFLEKVNAAELIGQFAARDYSRRKKPLFDERLAYVEISNNNKLPFFSNSFLIVSGKQNAHAIQMQGLGVLYTSDRSEEFQTVTRFVEREDNSIWAHKVLINQADIDNRGKLRFHPTVDKWQEGLSLHGLMSQRVANCDAELEELFLPCKAWVEKLKAISVVEGGTLVVDGRYLDCNWRNSYVHNGDCIFIDQEWEWDEKIPLNVIVIRAIYCFLGEVLFRDSGTYPSLRALDTKALFRQIAYSIGIDIKKSDFIKFCELESHYYGIVSAKKPLRFKLLIRLFLWSIPIYKAVLNIETTKIQMSVAATRLINYLYRQFDRISG